MPRIEWHEFVQMSCGCGFLRRSLQCDTEPGDWVLRQLLRRAIAGEIVKLADGRRTYMAISGRHNRLDLICRNNGFLERHDKLLNSLTTAIIKAQEAEDIFQELGFNQIRLEITEEYFRREGRVCSKYPSRVIEHEINKRPT